MRIGWECGGCLHRGQSRVTPGMAAAPVPLHRELCSGWAGARNHLSPCPRIPGHRTATTGPSRIPSSPVPAVPTSRCAWQNRLLQSSFWFGSGFVCSLRQNDAMAPPWEGWGAGMGCLAPVNQQPWKITAGGLGGWKESVLIGVFRLLDPYGQVTGARTLGCSSLSTFFLSLPWGW